MQSFIESWTISSKTNIVSYPHLSMSKLVSKELSEMLEHFQSFLIFNLFVAIVKLLPKYFPVCLFDLN